MQIVVDLSIDRDPLVLKMAQAMFPHFWGPEGVHRDRVAAVDKAKLALDAMRYPSFGMRKRCTFEQVEVHWPALIMEAIAEARNYDG